MSARSTLHALLLALILLVSACMKDEMALDAVVQLDALTDEIVKIISEAEDKQAGVAEAQAKLDAKKAELGPKMKEVAELRGVQVSEETADKIKNSLIDNTLKMVTLQMDLLVATATDPELQAAVDKLVDDHGALLSGE
ncbi:MAG: hypothetical protein R6X02_21815 [Enhygromyxa sp.]